MDHPALKTSLCRMLGIDTPILQAGMAFVARGQLAGAVSAAGGLGTIGGGSLSADELRAEIAAVRRITDRPFAVDILFSAVGGRNVQLFTDNVESQIEVIFEERVPVVVSGLGDPAPIVARCHDAGMRVLALTGNTRNAKRLAASKVDAIIAQGYDGGGHTGRVGTMTLIPATLDAVDLPVLAAGGIADGRGIAAALAMGAVGVWLGTRFIATTEAWGHERYKARIVEIDDEGTTRTRCFSGKPARVIRNRTTDAWDDPELAARLQPFPGQLANVTDWLGEDPYMAGRRDGKTDVGALSAGQSSVLVHDIEPAGEVLRELVAETNAALERLGR